jgi:hypothetical protein
MFTIATLTGLIAWLGMGLIAVVIMINCDSDMKTPEQRREYIEKEMGCIFIGIILWPLIFLVLLFFGFKKLLIFLCRA